MEITIGADGEKNCHLTITGQVDKGNSLPVPIVLFKDLAKSPRKLRIDGVQFAIQEKMGIMLWWIMPEEDKVPAYKLIMPLESRGGFDFEKIKPLSSPEGSLGIAMTMFKVTESGMAFLLMLDMTKQ